MAAIGQLIETSKGTYRLSEILGKGANGIVYLAFRQSDGYSLAIKVTKLHQAGSLNELQIGWIMALQKTTNVVKLEDHVVLNGHLYYVMELCKGGELFNYVIDKGILEEHTVRDLFHQLTTGLLSAHQQGIAHRDLKLENVLLTEDLKTVKIADFGLAAMSNSVTDNGLMFTKCGSLSYAAPELFLGAGYNPFKADVWSLGICLCTMLFSRLPFDVASPRSEAFATFKEAVRLEESSVLDEFLRCRPECREAMRVLKACLQINVKLRPTLQQLIQLPWMHGVVAPASLERQTSKSCTDAVVPAPRLVDTSAQDMSQYVLSSAPSTRVWAGFTGRMLATTKDTAETEHPPIPKPAVNLRHLGWVIPPDPRCGLNEVKSQLLAAVKECNMLCSQLDDTITLGVDQQISCTITQEPADGGVRLRWGRSTATPFEMMRIYRLVRTHFEKIRGSALLSNYEVEHTTSSVDVRQDPEHQLDEQQKGETDEVVEAVKEPSESPAKEQENSSDDHSGASDEDDNSGSEYVLFTAPCNRVWSEYNGSMATLLKRPAETSIEPQAKRVAA